MCEFSLIVSFFGECSGPLVTEPPALSIIPETKFFSGIARVANGFSASGERTCKLSAYWVAQIASVPHFYERHILAIKALINQSINHDLISDQKSRKR